MFLLRRYKERGVYGARKKTIMQIVVSLDGSKLAEAVIPQAVTLARATHSTITLLQVIPPPNSLIATMTALPENWYSENTTRSRDYLNAVAKGVQAIGVDAHIEIADGDPASTILSYVEAHSDVSLIAMASYGRDGIGRWFLGSVAQRVMHALPKPLLLLHPDTNETLQNRDIPSYHTIIVPLNESVSNDHMFDYVKPLAKTFGATITLVQVPPSGEQVYTGRVSGYFQQKAQQLRNEGFTVNIEVPPAMPTDLIQHLSEEQRGEVLVVGSNRESIEGLVMDFIRHVGVPVLMLPQSHS